MALDEDSTVMNQIITGVREDLKADLFTVSGVMDDSAALAMVRCVKKHRSMPNVMVILTTLGGSADAAYRMARFLRRQYDGKIILAVDSVCKSAGTLLALGADEIVMTDEAQLGPLDVQLNKPDELGDVSSGLTPVQALTFLQSQTFRLFEDHFLKLRFRSGMQITTKTAADIATRLTTGLFQPIYEQLDPLRLGENQRAMMIAYDYGERLVRKNAKPGTLDKLIAGYPSHSFVIDREEAGSLFRLVREPNPEEHKLLEAFGGHAYSVVMSFQEGAEVDFLIGKSVV